MRSIGRDTVLRIFWDGESAPSVETPLADFFCDPDSQLERIDSVPINKNRGWNCYLPMPFAKSARVEVSYENSGPPTDKIWANNPCYSYVTYRKMNAIPADSLYFHACWRQQTLLLGKENYKVFEAQGRGNFIGWNVTLRSPQAKKKSYPVDENPQIFVDGAAEPVIDWMGLEDSFGFSWGFPQAASSLPLYRLPALDERRRGLSLLPQRPGQLYSIDLDAGGLR